MEEGGSFNVEELRLSHESSTEWKLRREFLVAHHDKFPRNRLLCLASCFVNVECYSCRYPGPVMVQLEELASELSSEIQDHRNAIKQRNEVKFVKAGESSGSGSTQPTKSMTFVKSRNARNPTNSSRGGGMNFVKASEEFKSVNRSEQMTESHVPFRGQQRERAPVESDRRGTKRKQPPQSIDEFVILEPKERNESTNAASILNQSAQFNHMSIEFDFREKPVMPGDWQSSCQLTICGTVIAECSDTSKQAAKTAVCELALNKLKQTHYTLRIKQSADTDTTGITRDELIGKMNAGAIPDSNIGNKLLKMMGWSGGGVGKKGQGIAEPVTESGVVNREGLGLRAEQGISGDFLPKIIKTVQEYTRSDREDDLTFSPDFTKEERALIHRECQKLGLKTHSHGMGDDRFLVVSRKRSANQLFGHIMRSGGETNKYVLIPPGTDNTWETK